MRPSLSTTVASISHNVLIGFATAPPKCPECRSRLGPVTSISQQASPRSPVVSDGMSAPSMLVSDTSITSERNSSLCLLIKALRLGEPISSSPSKINLTLCVSRFSRTRYSNAFTCIIACPLSSSAPRAHILPSRISGSNGSLFHSSKGSAGITS